MIDPRDSDSPFGVLDFLAWDHPKFNHYYSLEDIERSACLMREAGVGFVRFDFLWEDIEPEPGRFDFQKYDRLTEIVRRHDIQIQGLLAYNPLWAKGHWNSAPDPVSYGSYANHVINHFKDRIRHWQIWQEPDNSAFWRPQDRMKSYTELLKRTYELLKQTDPTCIVHLGGMSQSLPVGLKNVYASGGGNYFDVIDIDPFANPLNADAVGGLKLLHQAVLSVIDEHDNPRKPIWYTEIGCPGMQAPASAPNWWLGENPTELVQADWVSTVYSEFLALDRVKKIFWCFFRDTEKHFNSGSDFDGLVRRDFSKKPSFEAYRRAAQSRRLSA